ncbi:MAG TPA: RES domain-containing protein [Gemmatimonadaceae bacterium]|nr:RES domain-containing protein [Gemmatimonadaceae bacterium]
MKTRFAAGALDGEGARLHGARWNSPVVAVAYAADSAALAVLEVLAHLQSVRHLDAYSMVSIEIPDALIETLDRGALPANWAAAPPPPEAQAIGDAWAASLRSAVLRVPSAIVPQSFIHLINPAHAESHRIAAALQSFRIDWRLV